MGDEVGPGGRADEVVLETVFESVVPHSPQNLTPGVFADPQFGQVTTRRVAHSPQNLRPTSFSVPQFGQITPSGTSSR
jgi:hypothetical protein